MRFVEAIKRLVGGLGRVARAVAEKLGLAEVATRLRSYAPIVILGLPEVANKILGGATGIKQLALAIAVVMFATGVILAVMYFTSRGLRERGKEFIEAACILCAVIGAGAAILAFAGDIGATIAGSGEQVKVENPWR